MRSGGNLRAIHAAVALSLAARRRGVAITQGGDLLTLAEDPLRASGSVSCSPV